MGIQYDSDPDGEAAHNAVKSKVEGAFTKYNNVPACIPTTSSSMKMTTKSKSKTTVFED